MSIMKPIVIRRPGGSGIIQYVKKRNVVAGSKLIVPANTVCRLTVNGRKTLFLEPNEYILPIKNVPFINHLVNMVFAGDDGVDVEAIFISKIVFSSDSFEMEIPVKDGNLPLVSAKVRVNVNFRVRDAVCFYETFADSNENASDAQIKRLVCAQVRQAVGSTVFQNALGTDFFNSIFANSISSRIIENMNAYYYGIVITEVNIEEIIFNEKERLMINIFQASERNPQVALMLAMIFGGGTGNGNSGANMASIMNNPMMLMLLMRFFPNTFMSTAPMQTAPVSAFNLNQMRCDCPNCGPVVPDVNLRCPRCRHNFMNFTGGTN